MNSTDYYDQNADEFFNTTCDVDMSQLYTRFEVYLPEKAKVLDAGCGSGRDSKHFLSQHYEVHALDASIEMVKRAKALTGLNVEQTLFQDITFQNEFDGIWTCASLLHVPKKNIHEIMIKFTQALKDNGIWYMSFKHGDHERKKDNRLFNDYTDESLKDLLSLYKELYIKEMWITEDKRPDRDDKWINVIVKKRVRNQIRYNLFTNNLTL